ncbi:hypothetical protein BJF95_05145 [Rhizobium oryziradicis]|uniref:Uncharacterized protein n=1 Tax=Rhizobium oryziradicis TaxID=1867956 RepID=A0A1Q8ZSV5_9HYPH|nr:hypothetical protein BJF95_05145 [Rhizobium oryziradicis]
MHSSLNQTTNEQAMNKKIAIITGSSRGLGRNMAVHLARRGVGIIGTYRNGEAEAGALRQEIEALGGKVAMIALDDLALLTGHGRQMPLIIKGGKIVKEAA